MPALSGSMPTRGNRHCNKEKARELFCLSESWQCVYFIEVTL
ncbi:MAG: hypothetical protein V8Q17_00305 [Acutalibacteraceae bacterium]